MYYIFYGFFYLISLLPLTILYLFSDLAYFLLYYVFSYRKKVVMDNLLQAFPEKTDQERKKIAKQFYLNFTDNFIEVIKLLSASPAFIDKHFTGDYTLCNKLYEEGKKCHFLLAHNFNWELGCLAVAQNIKQVFLVVYMPIGNQAFDKIFMKIRTKTGAELLPATDMRNAIIPYRNKLYGLALVADQNPGYPKNAYWLNFFGKPTPFVKGPESGARRGNTPVVFCKIIKLKRGYYRIFFEMGEEHPANTQQGELTKKYAQFLGNFIKEYPEMWLWSHRRWKWEWKPEYGEIIN
ncbi:MAG TPA: lysophospholipid acyltransferase family protein [Chitinophagaceae bacterium]|nr:lysophospholipid acyltransferase family protein [Chitinophagaceae bacterium]